MKKLMVFLCAMFLVFGYVGIASATAVYLPNVTAASGWSDVEQSSYGELCWAATASNMLAYTNWNGGTPLTTASQIFNDFSSSWTNVPGNPYYAIQWWFTGVNGKAGVSGWSQVTTPGGNFYSQALFDSQIGYTEAAPVDAEHWIKTNVGLGRIGTILLGNSTSGIHWLTFWGYDNASNGAWVTDSFDNVTKLEWASMTQDGSGYWHVTNLYDSSWYVLAECSFGMNSPYTAPNGTTGVPEPATLVLLGCGFVGLLTVRKKIQ